MIKACFKFNASIGIKVLLLDIKCQGIGKCCNISIKIKEEVKRLIKDVSGANVDLNDYVNVDVSGANVDADVVLGNSMSINDFPCSSFVSSLSSKRKVLNKDQQLAIAWKKQLHKNVDKVIWSFFLVKQIPNFKVSRSAYFHDMFNAVANFGPSYKSPSPFQLRKRHLNEEVKIC
jgi:hypothetical protein